MIFEREDVPVQHGLYAWVHPVVGEMDIDNNVSDVFRSVGVLRMADTSVGADTLAALADAGSSDQLIEVTAPSTTGLTGMRDALLDRPGADAVVPDLLVAGIEDQIGHSARRVGVRRTRSLVSVSSSKQQNGVTTLRHLHAACSHQHGQRTTPTNYGIINGHQHWKSRHFVLGPVSHERKRFRRNTRLCRFPASRLGTRRISTGAAGLECCTRSCSTVRPTWCSCSAPMADSFSSTTRSSARPATARKRCSASTTRYGAARTWWRASRTRINNCTPSLSVTLQ